MPRTIEYWLIDSDALIETAYCVEIAYNPPDIVEWWIASVKMIEFFPRPDVCGRYEVKGADLAGSMGAKFLTSLIARLEHAKDSYELDLFETLEKDREEWRAEQQTRSEH